MESVLMVSGGEKSAAMLLELLSQHNFRESAAAADAGAARRLFLERDFDLCVINAPLSDEFGDALARWIALERACQVILLVRSELADDIAQRVEDAGVLVLPKPVNRAMFWNVLKLAHAAYHKLARLQNQNAALLQRIEDIRVIDRAKYILMEYLKMSEAEAHRYIEKQAMDMRCPRKKIAQDILKTYES